MPRESERLAAELIRKHRNAHQKMRETLDLDWLVSAPAFLNGHVNRWIKIVAAARIRAARSIPELIKIDEKIRPKQGGQGISYKKRTLALLPKYLKREKDPHKIFAVLNLVPNLNRAWRVEVVRAALRCVQMPRDYVLLGNMLAWVDRDVSPELSSEIEQKIDQAVKHFDVDQIKDLWGKVGMEILARPLRNRLTQIVEVELPSQSLRQVVATATTIVHFVDLTHYPDLRTELDVVLVQKVRLETHSVELLKAVCCDSLYSAKAVVIQAFIRRIEDISPDSVPVWFLRTMENPQWFNARLYAVVLAKARQIVRAQKKKKH